MRKFFFTFLMVFIHCGFSMADDYEYVDLGLTSKTLWATCNIGASAPEEFGDFYAWGETTTKTSFTWSNYTHCGGSEITPYDIGENIISTSYDVATAVMGSDWCLPSREQVNELVNECTFSLVSRYGVVGFRIYGPNENSIFMPLSGYKYDSTYGNKGVYGYFWTGNSDVEENVAYKASIMLLDGRTKSAKASTLRRRTGMPVRAVRKTEQTSTPETPEAEYVDLGLTSKTLWATCNIGATAPEEFGDFYAWGETTTKTSFTWSNYTHCGGSEKTPYDIGANIISTSYDVATAVLGSDWCLPSREQVNELVKECTFSLDSQSGVVGFRIYGPNENSIFMPLSGYKYDNTYANKGVYGYFWTGNNDMEENVAYKASILLLDAGTKSAKASTLRRRTGMPVRAVRKTEQTSTPETTDIWKGEWVDLGLSVMWATSNFGASTATDTGQMFAWGETETKDDFTWMNYAHANGTASSVKDIGSDITATEYDPVRQWQKSEEEEVWRMPSQAEMEELLRNCTFTVTTVDGVKGYNVTGPSGKSIFLPFVGYKYDGKTVGTGTEGYYWSGTLATNKQRASTMYIKSGVTSMSDRARRTGVVIRPVYSYADPTGTEPTTEPEDQPTTVDEGTWTSDAVDLGLSVKWASCNFGAETEVESGDMYAWGEVATKSNFTWANYVYASGTAASVQNIGSEISDTEYDPVALSQASSNETEKWRMPTNKEIYELKTKCTFTVVTKEGTKGVKVTGPNGNSIFMPFCGYKYDGKFLGEGSYGYYWSSTLHTTTNQKAYALYVSTSSPVYTSCYRRTGIFIRPVCGATTPVEQEEDPDPVQPGKGPGPILADPTFSNQGVFETDGIENVNAQQSIRNEVYTLSGMKVDTNNLKPGVYVRNGKKFVVR